MKLTGVIQVLSAALAVFATLNLLLLLLADPVQRFLPVKLMAVTTYMDAVVAFGVGAGVYCLAVMAGGGAKASGGHH